MTQQFRKTAPRTTTPRTAVAAAPLQPQASPESSVPEASSLALVPHHVSYADAVRMMCLTDAKRNPRYESDYGPRPAGKLAAPHQEPEQFIPDENKSAADAREDFKQMQIRNRAARTVEAPFMVQSLDAVRNAVALALNGSTVPSGHIEDLFDTIAAHFYSTVSLQGYVTSHGRIIRRFSVSVDQKTEIGTAPTVDSTVQQFFVVLPADKNIKVARKQLWNHLMLSEPGEVIVVVARPEKRKYQTGREQFQHIQSCVHVIQVSVHSTVDA